MRRRCFWLGLEGLGLFLALGSVIEGVRSLSAHQFDVALGWFSVWAAGLAFHQWRRECRQQEDVDG